MDMGIDVTRRNKKPRPLSESEKDKLDEFVESIHYSARCARLSPLLARRLAQPFRALPSPRPAVAC